MARINWLDEETELPALDEHVQQLEHFTQSLADGEVDADELAKQNQAVVAAMKAVQDELGDEQHAKVTKLLVELTALNIMQTLHELAAGRARTVVGS
jgi:tape measure domain-containing protein